MNYEFKHLTFLAHRVREGHVLSNEDCVFLTDVRKMLGIADKELAYIDEMMEAKELMC